MEVDGHSPKYEVEFTILFKAERAERREAAIAIFEASRARRRALLEKNRRLREKYLVLLEQLSIQTEHFLLDM